MKYARMLGLLAVVVAALMVSAAAASADSFTSPTGVTYTGNLVFESEGHVVLDNPIAKIECASQVEGSVESHGAGQAVSGNISSLSFTGCTDSWHVTVVAAGSLSVESSGGYDGTIFSSGLTLEATRFGITCRYATSNTHIGEIKGGSPATLETRYAISYHSGSIFCGSGATSWTGSYTVNTPNSLYVDNN